MALKKWDAEWLASSTLHALTACGPGSDLQILRAQPEGNENRKSHLFLHLNQAS